MPVAGITRTSILKRWYDNYLLWFSTDLTFYLRLFFNYYNYTLKLILYKPAKAQISLFSEKYEAELFLFRARAIRHLWIIIIINKPNSCVLTRDFRVDYCLVLQLAHVTQVSPSQNKFLFELLFRGWIYISGTGTYGTCAQLLS